MSAEVELLREAARLMRYRAAGATRGRWEADAETVSVVGEVTNVCDAFGLADKWPNARHIASWDPAVALTVADWLDAEASVHEMCATADVAVRVVTDNKFRVNTLESTLPQAVAVARAYLRREA